VLSHDTGLVNSEHCNVITDVVQGSSDM